MLILFIRIILDRLLAVGSPRIGIIVDIAPTVLITVSLVSWFVAGLVVAACIVTVISFSGSATVLVYAGAGPSRGSTLVIASSFMDFWSCQQVPSSVMIKMRE